MILFCSINLNKNELKLSTKNCIFVSMIPFLVKSTVEMPWVRIPGL